MSENSKLAICSTTSKWVLVIKSEEAQHVMEAAKRKRGSSAMFPCLLLRYFVYSICAVIRCILCFKGCKKIYGALSSILKAI